MASKPYSPTQAQFTQAGAAIAALMPAQAMITIVLRNCGWSEGQIEAFTVKAVKAAALTFQKRD